MLPFLHPLRVRATLFAAIAAGTMIWIACDATGPRAPGPLTLSITTTPTASAAIARGTGPSSVRVTSAEFVLARTELARSNSCAGTPAGDGCHALAADPLLIQLSTSAARPRKVAEALVAAGTYTGVQSELHAVPSEGGLRTRHPDWPAGVSVRVTGVYTDPQGVAHDFTFTSAAEPTLHMAFARPVRVDGASQNVTILVDVARWFRNGRGTVIDPRSSANAVAINANIQNSFRAVQDDDEDGVDDDPNEGQDDAEDADTAEADDDAEDADTAEADDDAEDDDTLDADDLSDVSGSKDKPKGTDLSTVLRL